MKDKTLVELIEDILEASSQYEDTLDEAHILILNDRASVLSERMGCSNVAAICFAFILFEAAWGRMPTRSDIMKFLPPSTSIVERLEGVWELLNKKLILVYKPMKNPRRHFYIDQDVAEKVVANRVPTTTHQSLFPIEEYRQVRINATSGQNDYEILLDGKVVGFIMMSADNCTYEVYWLGLLVHSSDEFSGIVEWLNEAYDNGTLKPSQI